MTDPDDDVTPEELVRPIVAELDALARSADRLRDALAALPGLMNDWTVGEPDEAQSLLVEVLAGPGAVADAWDRLTPGRGRFVLPDLRVLGELRPAPAGIRVIVGPADAADTAAALAEADRLGAEVRSLADPPSWFAVDDTDRCGYPARWEIARPEHVLLLHDPVAAGGFRMLFEELWRRAAPLGASTPDWEPVLELLDRGLTEAEVASALHVSERTVRRRIRDAATAFGTRGRFALGLARATSAERGPGAR